MDKLQFVDDETSAEPRERWNHEEGGMTVHKCVYLIGGVVRVLVAWGAAVSAHVFPEDRHLCASAAVEHNAAQRALRAHLGRPALVYIDATGGSCEVNTSGPVSVLQIDFALFEEDPAYDVRPDPAFLEAFPFLAKNLEAARARRRVAPQEGAQL